VHVVSPLVDIVDDLGESLEGLPVPQNRSEKKPQRAQVKKDLLRKKVKATLENREQDILPISTEIDFTSLGKI
jgi:hypothetical protein